MQVTSASQAAARDAAAISARGESFSLMAAAGTGAAAAIMRLDATSLARGVHVFVGGGNNGGDGYVVAAQLARIGVRVHVHVVAPPRSPDCLHAAAIAQAIVPNRNSVTFLTDAPMAPGAGGVVVDALLGTGAAGPLRAEFAAAVACINRARDEGSTIIALDVPTGVDATTGALCDDYVRAHHTLTFGTIKSGLLAARAACGRVQLLDIGLGPHARVSDNAPQLATADALRGVVPPIAWDAHKGTRGRVLLVGGSQGMAGAVQLAAHGALSSGAGLVRAAVHEQSIVPMQSAVPAVVTMPWHDDAHVHHADLDESLAVHLDETSASPSNGLADAAREWAHTVAIGPGLGRDARASRLVSQLLTWVSAGTSALVLDADAITLLAEHGVRPAFAICAATRPVVLTPHAGEFAALAQRTGVVFDRTARDPAARLESVRALASTLGCTVLLKGAPTLCASRDGEAWCVPRGSAALATGGTGDVLTGVLAAVLAAEMARGERASASTRDGQHGAAAIAASRVVAQSALSAWVHGVAGEFGDAAHAPHSHGAYATVRGRTVIDVINSLPYAWAQLEQPEALAPGVLTELPALAP